MNADPVTISGSPSPYTFLQPGMRGSDGHNPIVGTQTYPTDGISGPSIDLLNTGNIVAANTTAAFFVDISGGAGGNGDTAVLSITEAQHGGSGGNGGMATVRNEGSLSGSFSGGAFVDASGGAGGSYGGAGGAGGIISFDNALFGKIRTQLPLASLPAVHLQADGGLAGSFTLLGGSGGLVTVANEGTLETNSLASEGILAVARGGAAGGTVNVSNAGKIRTTGDASAAIAVSAAGGASQGSSSFSTGTGGGGGNLRIVTTSSSIITTAGAGSTAIRADANGGNGSGAASTGGGLGGAGGIVAVDASGYLTTTGVSASAIQALALGGVGGGSGGIGGKVTVTADLVAPITVGGDQTPAIIASANGGNGTNGSYAYGSASLGVALRAGGNGGTVDVSVAGTLATAGVSSSPGVIATSKGGDGAFGPGGTGGSGGSVLVASSAALSTVGANSPGLLALSAGGAGGDGRSVSGGIAASGDSGSPGGSDVSNGADPIVAVRNAGIISTTGDFSEGINAQSIGGVGGNGGTADTLIGADGGAAGAAGRAGDIFVRNAGDIKTSGAQSHGIFAQSVGGGGANGGDASATFAFFSLADAGSGSGGGGGGTVQVVNDGRIGTAGAGSDGILGLSVGGGGGNGGNASSNSAGVGFSLSIAVGGNAGPGGDGGRVDVNNAGSIFTFGDDAHGIQVISVGGGGGTGGQAGASAYAIGFQAGDVEIPAVALAFSTGGSGGDGGRGSDVKAANTGQIYTAGAGSFGISALSIGGGGGSGGSADALAYAVAYKTISIAEAVAVGGSGGKGGVGGSVNASNAGTLVTDGYAADAVHAASIGGGGGTGALGSAETKKSLPFPLSLFVSDTMSVSVSVSVGGSGGLGGSGGSVTIDNAGTVATSGVDARGVFAQSVGGGGGSANGGEAVGGSQYAVTVGVGGSGGAGGSGGDVSVTNRSMGTITTVGEGAHGILAQSIGGGGGSGGASSAGSAQSQLKKTAITAGKSLYTGILQKYGDKAVAALKREAGEYLKNYTFKEIIGKALAGKVSSILGSQVDKAKNKSLLPSFSASLNVSVGGTGGASGNGGHVGVSNDGIVSTGGDLAFGIFAQSVGGGGGEGGAVSAQGANIANISLGLGGGGGAGGSGGEIDVGNQGKIVTDGDASFGIAAQSIGGGGGKATVALNGALQFTGQPIHIGGSNGAVGDGGNVTVGTTGSVQTAGSEAHAIVAQSIGGGGGLFLFNTVAQAATADGSEPSDPGLSKAVASLLGQPTDDGSTLGAALAGAAAAQRLQAVALTVDTVLNIGADAGVSGNGGAVTVNVAGTIATSGANSFGIVAQSIGGGGGLAAEAGSTVSTGLHGTIGGGRGDGGAVTVALAGRSQISTDGIGSVGIFAQSVGGGGGYTGAFNAAASSWPTFLGGFSGSGTGGLVTIAMKPGGGLTSINTTGANAHGVFAQSLNDGGGAVGSGNGITIPDTGFSAPRTGGGSSGRSGGVKVDLAGSINTRGDGSIGIFAQSGTQGVGGGINGFGGDIAIAFSGSLVGGAGAGSAIALDGGLDNTVTIAAGSRVAAVSGVAMTATQGNNTVENFGTIIGDLRLATAGFSNGLNTFNNEAGAIYHTGNAGVIDLGNAVGATGTFNNAGAFYIRGLSGPIMTAALAGNYAQSASGSLVVDLDARAGTADVLKVSGTAMIAGSVQPVLTTLPAQLTDGRFSFTVVNAAVLSSTAQPVDTIAVRYALASSPTSLGVAVTGVNFSPAAVVKGADNTAIANNLQSIWASGNLAGLAPTLVKLANVPIGSNALYNQDLKKLGTGTSTNTDADQPKRMAGFQGALNSCPVFVGESALLTEQSCLWTRAVYSVENNFVRSDADGSRTFHSDFQIGGQKAYYDGWFLGGALLAGSTDQQSSDGSYSAHGEEYAAGVVVKKRLSDTFMVSLSGSYAYSHADATRYITSPVAQNDDGSVPIARAKQTTNSAGTRLRSQYFGDLGGFYWKPFLDLDGIFVETPSYSERNAGIWGLNYKAESAFHFGVSPSLEIGARVNMSDGILRPYVSAGPTYWTGADGWSQAASFEGSALGAHSFTNVVNSNALSGRGTAGAEFISTDGFEIRAEYNAQGQYRFLNQAFTGRLGYRFSTGG